MFSMYPDSRWKTTFTTSMSGWINERAKRWDWKIHGCLTLAINNYTMGMYHETLYNSLTAMNCIANQ